MFNTKPQRVAALQNTAIFGGLPKSDIASIERHSTQMTVTAGAEMAVQDRAPLQMFVIASGTAVVKRNNRKIASLGAGDTVGELSLLDGGKQTATVIAHTDCEVLVVAVNEFKIMLDESPTFTRKLLKSLAMRLREADKGLGV
jgi:CRP/FNR family cyclic AMP-dependent transcriptional regulator